MNTKTILLSLVLILMGLYTGFAQVGIGTTDPKTSLQVQGDPENITMADGVQVPVLTLAQLEAKVTAYGPDQNGAIVYIDDISDSGTGNTTIANISTAGYYYYDAANLSWQAMSGGTPGATRSLQTDLLLTSTLCNCTRLPPAMIQSLLNSGYTSQDLIDFEIPVQDLVDGGLTAQDLVDGGLTVQDLIDSGLTVQDLLDGGLTPMNLFNGGVVLDSIIGKTYQGGLIFFVDTNDTYPFEGLVAAPSDQSTDAEWGCYGTDLNGNVQNVAPKLSGVGDGQANTTAIVNGCSDSGIAARICDDLDLNGYSDWFLPSVDEMNLIYNNIGSGATGSNQNIGNFSGDNYWSSTEVNSNFSFVSNLNDGFIYIIFEKYSTYSVRAVRAF